MMHVFAAARSSVLSTLSLLTVASCASPREEEIAELQRPSATSILSDGGTSPPERRDDAGHDTERGPAYAVGSAGCPPADGRRRIKLVNNCAGPRWFKLDGRTTPTWARPTTCPWAGETCTDIDGISQCQAKARAKSAGVDPGSVYCKATSGGGRCACNPHFELAPGAAVEIPLPDDAAFPSGTGWIATGCNALGASCSLGDSAARNSTFEWTYDRPGAGALYYDISAVNAWTTASAVGMKSCGGKPDPKDPFRCGGAGCRFDVETQCPDGSPAFPPARAPNGASANEVPANTVFNRGGVGGAEWRWTGSPDFAMHFGFDEGAHAARRYTCAKNACTPARDQANTCLGGCDLCTTSRGVSPGHPDCIKYCCPDVTRTYESATYRYDSAGCTALGVQKRTDYTVALKAACPFVYTYGYEDHSSTFVCESSASLLVEACPDPIEFPTAPR
jgi:hypothetical protein